MITDFFYKKGSSHETCQDYALCSENSIFLADGCSSAQNSDMGARILTLLAKKYESSIFYGDILERYYKIDEIFSQIGKDALEIVKDLGLNTEALFSTLLTLSCEKTEPYYVDDYDIPYRIYCSIIGDGVAAFVRNDNSIKVYDIDFKKQAPKYLAYRLFDDWEKGFWEIYYNYRTLTIYDIINGKIENKVSKVETSYEDNYIFEVDKKEFKCGAIMSDGVKTFLDNSDKEISLEVILPKILDFKQTTSNFLKRRMNRFFKDNEKDNITHYDDFSIAAINF